MGHLSLVHVRSVVLWERARLRVYDLWATRTGMFSFRKMLVTLWFSRSEMYGILKYDHSALVGRASLWLFRGHFARCMLFSGYPFRRRMSSNAFWCFVVVVCVEHLSSIRFRSLRMKLVFDFLGMADLYQGQVPYFQHQPVLTKKLRLPNHM